MGKSSKTEIVRLQRKSCTQPATGAGSSFLLAHSCGKTMLDVQIMDKSLSPLFPQAKQKPRKPRGYGVYRGRDIGARTQDLSDVNSILPVLCYF